VHGEQSDVHKCQEGSQLFGEAAVGAMGVEEYSALGGSGGVLLRVSLEHPRRAAHAAGKSEHGK